MVKGREKEIKVKPPEKPTALHKSSRRLIIKLAMGEIGDAKMEITQHAQKLKAKGFSDAEIADELRGVQKETRLIIINRMIKSGQAPAVQGTKF